MSDSLRSAEELPPPREAKRLLRRRFLRQLKARAPEDIRQRSLPLSEHLASLESFSTARCVFSYAALPGEADIAPLWERFRQAKRWVFPKVDGTRLDWYHCSEPDALKPGAFGIREPDPDRAPRAELSDADVILVPGLAFATATGARLGRGAGHYDRVFAALDSTAKDPVSIGVALVDQLLPELPQEPHDRTMDWLCTEEGPLSCGE